MQPLSSGLSRFVHMRVHRMPSAVNIALCDTLQDVAMVSERSGGGTRSPPAESAELNEHVTDGAQ